MYFLVPAEMAVEHLHLADTGNETIATEPPVVCILGGGGGGGNLRRYLQMNQMIKA